VTFMRERIERGEAPLWGAFLSAGSPLMAEMLSRSGFDWLVIDMPVSYTHLDVYKRQMSLCQKHQRPCPRSPSAQATTRPPPWDRS